MPSFEKIIWSIHSAEICRGIAPLWPQYKNKTKWKVEDKTEHYPKLCFFLDSFHVLPSVNYLQLSRCDMDAVNISAYYTPNLLFKKLYLNPNIIITISKLLPSSCYICFPCENKLDGSTASNEFLRENKLDGRDSILNADSCQLDIIHWTAKREKSTFYAYSKDVNNIMRLDEEFLSKYFECTTDPFDWRVVGTHHYLTFIFHIEIGWKIWQCPVN